MTLEDFMRGGHMHQHGAMPVMVHYTLPMRPSPVTLSGGRVVLEGVPQCDFRPTRIVAGAEVKRPAWTRALLWLRWIMIPWVVRKWDEDDERTWWRLALVRPFYAWWERIARIADMEFYSKVFVRSIRVDDTENLVGAGVVPLSVFAPTAFGIHLSLNTCKPGKKISIELEGEGGPFSIVLIGTSPAPPGYEPPPQPDYSEDDGERYTPV